MELHHSQEKQRSFRASVPPQIHTNRLYPNPSYASAASSFPFSPSATPTPSKRRYSSYPSASSSSKTSSSSLFLLLFSLGSLYNLIPFLRSSPPSFSLFPFSFLVSLLSFVLHLCSHLMLTFSGDLKKPQRKQRFDFSLITPSLLRALFAKSSLLALIFVLRFHALRSCGTAATITAEYSGNLAAEFVADGRRNRSASNRLLAVRGFAFMFLGLLLLSFGWDRVDCFPLSSSENVGDGSCTRILPMLFPFLSGFLDFYERASANWGSFRHMGRKWVRTTSLFTTTLILFLPAAVSFLALDKGQISLWHLGWSLGNTVIFGVILSDRHSDDRIMFVRDRQKDFLMTFFCTLVLELLYFPELALPGFLFCGFFLWLSVKELGSYPLNYPELGSGSPETFSSTVWKAIRHILGERKSRKIALFLAINTSYMVVEFVVGFTSNSLGLISDACHMLFDCAALAIGLYASYISRLPANNQFNFGHGRFEILSGYVNAVLLVLVGALIVLESFERILDPQEISTSSLLAVSVGGLVVNVVGLIFFHEEHHHAHGSCSHVHHHHQSNSSNNHSYSHHEPHHEGFQYLDAHELSNGRSDHTHAHDICVHDHHHHQNPRDDSVGMIKETDHHHSIHHYIQHDPCVHDDKKKLDDLHCNHHDGQFNHGAHVESAHNLYFCQKDHHHHDDTEQHFHPHHADSFNGVTLSHLNPAALKNSCNDSLKGLKHEKSQGSCCGNRHNSHTNAYDDLSKIKLHGPQKHRHMDHNMEGIFLHVLADTLGSVGVVIATLLIKYKGWLVADPACSIFISILIVSSVVPLLRNSAEILLQRVPRSHEHDINSALDKVMGIEGIHGIQNIHAWSLTNTDIVGTLHVHLSEKNYRDSVREEVSSLLHGAGINDVTIQLECPGGK